MSTRPTVYEECRTQNHRKCACGCGVAFAVPASRPDQQYRYGHLPKSMRPTPARICEALEERRGLLDYRLTRSNAAAEALQLERKMDTLDDEIDQLRAAIRSKQEQKDEACRRHLALESLLALLDHLVDGKPLPLPTEEVNDATAA